MPTSSSNSSVRARARRLSMPMCSRSTSPIWAPTVNTGFSEDIGSWKIIAISLPHMARRWAAGRCSTSRPSNSTLPWRSIRVVCGGSKPMTASELTDLPLPDSPTRATVRLCGTSKEMPFTASSVFFLSMRKRMRRLRTCSSMSFHLRVERVAQCVGKQ